MSSRVSKPLSFMSMSLANGLGRSVSGPTVAAAAAAAVDGGGTGTTTGGGADSSVISATTKGYASAIPTKIKV